ncbi:MAG: hypothetical protein PHH49_06165 [Candidatus Omnitrophica bacterium]|nr:hypothetical protein [Candidatus Omnitrophota bacterium]MDD5488525.1 hypothetical protein [Candidatus Omnitrophota bacterium]
MRPKVSIGRILIGIIAFFVIITMWYIIEEKESMRVNNAMLSKEKKALEEKIKSLFKDKATLETSLEAVRGEKELLTGKMEEYQQENEKLSETIKTFNDQMIAVQDNMQKKDTEISELRNKINVFTQEKEDLIAQLEKARSMPAIAVAEEEEEEAGWRGDPSAVLGQLEPIIVEATSPQSGYDSAPKAFIETAVEGDILDVNKEYNFVVLNIGAGHGVKAGDLLFVVRDKKLLGRVQVTKTGPDVSVAEPMYKALRDNIKKGDKVKY